MISEGQFKKLEDRVLSLRARPSVGVFIDLDSLLVDIEEVLDKDTYENISDHDIADTVAKLAQSVGRPNHLAIYYSGDTERVDGIDHRAWRSNNIEEIRTPQEGYSKEDINIPLILDAQEAAMGDKFEVCILIVGQTDYTALARRLLNRGITVLMVSNYPPNKRVLPRDNCAYIPMRSLFEDMGQSSVDPDKFDYDKLIRLLYESEKRMPFVGVRYFIQHVMWRLGTGFKSATLCQRVFQGAKDRELVEVYKFNNIDRNRKEVSACKLVRENARVTEVIEDVEQRTSRTGSEEEEGTVNVQHGSLLDTDSSVSSSTPSPQSHDTIL
jgi:hypothetical protein